MVRPAAFKPARDAARAVALARPIRLYFSGAYTVALAAVVPRRHTAAWPIALAVGEGLAVVLFVAWRPLV